MIVYNKIHMDLGA